MVFKPLPIPRESSLDICFWSRKKWKECRVSYLALWLLSLLRPTAKFCPHRYTELEKLWPRGYSHDLNPRSMATPPRGPSSHTDYNCSWDLDPQSIEPNGDISGPGVLAGFLGPAYFVVLVIVCYYFLVFEPDRNPFKSRPKQDERRAENAWRPNPIDGQTLSILRTYVLRFNQWQSTRDRIKWNVEKRFKKASLILPSSCCAKSASKFRHAVC